ncbi:isoprenylcysteine carboxylmethyltransferase family protein [Mucilaginibacter sp. 10I4]|uniref:methyltransferase family protein n=1 Tax=Mucilaginibacter sp. 10I4 TaxID=3048580 RepID=UPI002B22CB3B|nr:isoprenylcysteine carboxylmethyltransferase family protein [Mucilaginibacter sp. 10I4]MEB0260721.1 isoprenylcysteine carboxylmethyltransferase family protein [Mucilaginibacter sp. 10I4]
MKSIVTQRVGLKDKLYVAFQFILLGIYFVNICPLHYDLPGSVKYMGLTLAILGTAEVFAAIYQLRKHLTPYPTPTRGAALIVQGIYKYVRHPIYGGIITFTGGYSLFSQSVGRLMLVIVLVILFYFKSVYEEHLLRKQFQDYEAYKRKTFRFFPFIVISV